MYDFSYRRVLFNILGYVINFTRIYLKKNSTVYTINKIYKTFLHRISCGQNLFLRFNCMVFPLAFPQGNIYLITFLFKAISFGNHYKSYKALPLHFYQRLWNISKLNFFVRNNFLVLKIFKFFKPYYGNEMRLCGTLPLLILKLYYRALFKC